MLYFLTVFVVLAGTVFSSADNAFDSVLEMRNLKLDRRDVGQSFQQQLKALLPFDIANTSVCTSPPCLSGLDPSLCSAFNTSSRSQFGTILTHFTSCYVAGFCNTNFVTRSVYNVNISLPTPENYEGQCYLYGPKIDFKFDLTSATPGIMEYVIPAYFASEAFTYTFTGLSVRCQPCPGPATAPPADNCCPNDLLTQLLCLVQNLLSSLSLNIPLVNCQCDSSGSIFGKRGALNEGALSERQAGSMGFESVVSAVLSLSFRSYFVFRAGTDPYYEDAAVRASTSVSLGAQVPGQYEADLIAGIQSVFEDYNVFYFLLYYYNAITRDLILSFYKTCPGAA